MAVRKDWNGAIAKYEQVLAHVPDEPYTLVQLSYMHSLLGAYRRAEDCAIAASRTGVIDPQVVVELLPRLRTLNLVQELLACVERMLPMSRMPIPLLIRVAAQLSYLNLPERAIEFLDEARLADPDFPTTLLARAQVLTYLGRFAEAEEDVRRSMRRAPEIAQGYWLQAWVRKQTAEHNHVDAIRRELRRSGRTADDVALLCFALHKELDDLGRYDEAWQALMQGCAAKRSRQNYDPQRMHRIFEALERMRPDGDSATIDPSRVPIFIVGMHRSGTTLLEQMLAGHSQVRTIGELYDFVSAMRHATDHHCKGVIDETIIERGSRADLSMAGRRYLESVAWRLGDRRLFTDKLPSNFLNIGFIVRALPHSKILHMVRDPVETCFSNLRELFSDANPYSYDMVELAEYFNLYRELMASWHEKFPGRILDVHYSKLLAEPATELHRVAHFCGIDFEESMLELESRQRSVVTASAVQVRSEIQVRERPKWAPYEMWLQPLIERLAP